MSGKRIVVGDDTLLGVECEEEFTLNSGDSVRTFRLLLYNIDEATTAVAIVDEDARRILLDGHGIAKRGGRSPVAEMRWIKEMSYGRFRDFVNGHSRRRYKL